MNCRVGILVVIASLTSSCSPWAAYRTARLRATEDLRCADERVTQITLGGDGGMDYGFRGCGHTAIYQCMQHPSITLCRRVY